MADNKIKIREILKFIVGGGSAVLVDYILYRLLMDLGLPVSISKGISYVTGAAVGFVINKLWTFESKQFSSIEVVKYILLYACSACANAGVNKFILWLFNWQLFAFLCATGVSTVMNFLGQKFFVFVKEEAQE
ncbi:MAG: GtrA family protein [Spirochaetaceae bacterium]|nr:GtrA family protein [Spirochaetaceae bacterium]